MAEPAVAKLVNDLVDDEFVLNRENLASIEMPNADSSGSDSRGCPVMIG